MNNKPVYKLDNNDTCKNCAWRSTHKCTIGMTDAPTFKLVGKKLFGLTRCSAFLTAYGR